MATIIVDAGHGGHDSGGATLGRPEKETVLRYALALTQALAIAGHRAVPTRVFDQFVEIRDRAALSNQVDADLFLSIHANASKSPRARGAWTLYAAVSTAGKSLAADFQRAMIGPLGGRADAVYPDDSGWTGGRRIGVLRQTRAPAVLLELGFMTNRDDVAIMESDAVMKKTVAAIVKVVDDRFPR